MLLVVCMHFAFCYYCYERASLSLSTQILTWLFFSSLPMLLFGAMARIKLRITLLVLLLLYGKMGTHLLTCARIRGGF